MSIPDPQRTVCPKCGSIEREGEDFCVCGEYLGWDDPEPPAEDETVPAEPAPEPAPDDRPDVASVELRLPDREHRPGAPVRLKVDPGQTAKLVARVRNEGRLVDDWTVTVGGMPEDWWTVKPDVVSLLPQSDRDGDAQEVEIELHPPRDVSAEARDWPLEVVATPVDTGAAVTREPFTLTVARFSAHTLDVRPRRSTGRRAGHHAVTVHNRGNSRLDARLEAFDDDGAGRYAFEPPLLDLRPGESRVSQLQARGAAPIVVGKDRELALAILSHAGDEEPQRAEAAYRQRAWLPPWAIPLALAVIALIVVLLVLV